MSRELHEKTQRLFTKLFFTEIDGRHVIKLDPDSVRLRKEFYEKLINNNEFIQLVRKTGTQLSSTDRLEKYFLDKNSQEYSNIDIETGIIRALVTTFNMMGREEYEDEIWRIIYEILVSFPRDRGGGRRKSRRGTSKRSKRSKKSRKTKRRRH
jgi:hypothetical protein